MTLVFAMPGWPEEKNGKSSSSAHTSGSSKGDNHKDETVKVMSVIEDMEKKEKKSTQIDQQWTPGQRKIFGGLESRICN